MNHSNPPGDYLTVKDRVAEEVGIARRAWLDGKQVGIVSGHEAGHIVGYTAGYHDGLRSSIQYRQGAKDGYMDGWQDGRRAA